MSGGTTSTIDETSIGHVSQVPLGVGRKFDLDGQVIAVFRRGTGEVFATHSPSLHTAGAVG